jgi:dTDP-4-amino-4,6-dideoxygalactose transaminase
MAQVHCPHGKLPLLEDELAARDRVAAQYAARLGSALKTPATLPDGVHAWGIYSILLASEAQRSSVQAAMQARGVPSAIYYPRPLHHQPAYATAHAACLAGGPPALPVSEELCQRILCLPMHPYLDAGQVDRVADAVHAGLQ